MKKGTHFPFVRELAGGWLAMLITSVSPAASDDGGGKVEQDVAGHTVTMSDAEGHLRLRLNYDGRCLIDHVIVRGREVIDPSNGVCTAINVGGEWKTTRGEITTPVVTVKDKDVTVSGIACSLGGVSVRETWTFHVGARAIDWEIAREYPEGGTLDDSYLPGWDFTDASTWTAGLLDTGGVAWWRYIADGHSYGTHSGSALLWKDDLCLKISTSVPAGIHSASRFSHHPSGAMTFCQSATTEPLATKHDLRRSVGAISMWAPFKVVPGTVRTRMTIEAPDGAAVRSRGDFKGVDGKAVAELLDTIGRYGVIDRGIMGGNGWLTGFVCLHEPFLAEMGAAVADPNFTANLALALDQWRDHALQPDGRLISRWHHDTSDNMVPGTYDPATGYYECGWGVLIDTQACYPIVVSGQFDLSGDLDWLRTHKQSCERALDWLLNRDSDHDGLVEAVNDSHKEGKSSDWIDVVWASGENALVNAELYQALTLWSEREDILGDHERAVKYHTAAARLKAAFVKPLDQGGFWDPDKGWFAYWRDKDGSVHGDNLVTPVNFCAIAYGLADESQSKRVLETIEAKMREEKLFHWPICFLPFTPAEGGRGEFPTYENGDIFLSWGEVAVRSYASHDPALAMAYVSRILEQYRKDGLSFQRYLRRSQEGAGEDILAGNSMTIVGLCRDILGVRPQWNRLMLDPHLTSEVAGTRLSYPLRGQHYDLTLDVGKSAASVDGFTVEGATPFGLQASDGRVSWFNGTASSPALSIDRGPSAPISLNIGRWTDASRQWTETYGGKDLPLKHVVSGLKPGAAYALSIAGGTAVRLVADAAGNVPFESRPASAEAVAITLDEVK